MSINVTLFVQMLVFALLVWFTMKFIWPVILEAMEEREQRIADGLAAAEKGRSELEAAATEAESIVSAARDQARDILGKANSRAAGIVEEARTQGEEEKRKRLESAQAEIDVEVNRARDELRGQVAAIAVAGAEKVLAREIDTDAHRELLDRLAADL
ncbi:MAG: F0F1 ATP synthase subunit B [Proteobacteria bacterium]|nr:F0F1 ATP synthase subunit B [Pseudomonadota bacterium]MYJ97089.1 F0F1 ATP synthase subunit B [Pseudomonadota bacterium]